MPISSPLTFHQIDDQVYRQSEYIIMGHAFDIHNRIGRFCNELIFQNEMKARCLNDFKQVEVEAPICLTFDNYQKRLRMDMLINGTIILELKKVSALSSVHQAQLMNYLCLTELNLGKLINFGNASVEDRYVSTTLTYAERTRLIICDFSWKQLSERARWMKEMMIALLYDWGAFLTPSLYEEAIIYFLGGEDKVTREVSLSINGRYLGTQNFNLLSDSESFVITSYSEQEGIATHLQRQLSMTKLKCMYWINLNHHDIRFRTLINT